MVISPNYYKEQFKEKSLKELILERNNLIEKLNQYENKKILQAMGENETEDFVKPSPKDIYYWNNYYLKEITDLIIEKLKKNQGE